MKKDINKGLLVSVVVLSLLVLGLSSYLIYDKVLKEDNNETEIIDTEVIGTKEVISKFVGKYEYEYTYENSECVPNGDAKYAINLQLNDDGTYSYGKGGDCTGGTNAKGKYAISEEKIYLFNDECELNENGEYPNCQKIVELKYKEDNSTIIIIDLGMVSFSEKFSEVKLTKIQ